MAIESNASKNHAVQMISRIFRCQEQYGSRSSRATMWRMSPLGLTAAVPADAAMVLIGFPPPGLRSRRRVALCVALPRRPFVERNHSAEVVIGKSGRV